MTENIRKISEITIGYHYRKDSGDLQALADSIKAIGLLHPVVINKNDHLIAGARRIRAFKLLGRAEIPVTVVDLAEIVRGEFAENEQRKDFTPSEAVAIGHAVKPMIAAEAKARQAAGGKLKAGAKLAHAAKGKTRDKVSRYTGIKRTTLKKAEAVVAAAEAEPENKEIASLVKTMDETGKVDGAYKQLKATKHNPPSLDQQADEKRRAYNQTFNASVKLGKAMSHLLLFKADDKAWNWALKHIGVERLREIIRMLEAVAAAQPDAFLEDPVESVADRAEASAAASRIKVGGI
jgi:ParB-like chromosome segregation protein Spo0J